jgi:LmbE family N-acetylglucosaminyl deacetylase
MSHPGGNLEKSIIIAAHPDDEILWFSSIIESVDELIICFLDVESQPEWSSGRRKSISDYPLDISSCLGLTESEVFDGADWTAPASTVYGLEIVGMAGSVIRYEENYRTLKTVLAERLKGYTNVYTHNPWGEYGHEEHVQVYRAVKSLQSSMHFSLWYTGYFSNKSVLLMNHCLARSNMHSFRLAANKPLASDIMGLYMRNHCWTWYEDYSWPDQESFIHDGITGSQKDTFGKTLDLNYIKVWLPQKKSTRRLAFLRRAMRSMSGKDR